MEKIIFQFLVFVSFYSCKDDDTIIPNSPNPEPPSPSCVVEEMTESNETNFYVFEPGDQEYGYAAAIKLNKEWNASAKAFFSTSDTIFITFSTYHTNNQNFTSVREKITFKEIPLTKNCYALITENSIIDVAFPIECIYRSFEGDVINDKYYVDENTENNYLEIDSVNIENNYLSGKFSISFLKDTTFNLPEHQNEWNPNMVRFFNGKFEAKIKE